MIEHNLEYSSPYIGNQAQVNTGESPHETEQESIESNFY